MRYVSWLGVPFLALLVALAAGCGSEPTYVIGPGTKPTSRPSQPSRSTEQIEATHKASVEPIIEATRKAAVEPMIEIDLGGGVTMKMVLIPAGTFKMGSPETEDKRDTDEVQHDVTLTKPFYMGRTEVTQAQWEAVMGTRPWELQLYAQVNPEHAANYVSWTDCQEFLRRLNAKVRGGGFRLPTEAEWECACRAGSTTRFYYGDDPDCSQLGRYAWYSGNTFFSKGGNYPHAVGTKQPNDYGLYDMHGNVWEWCQDWYGEHARGRLTDPTGPGAGTSRMLRGGGWLMQAEYCRSASRNWSNPATRYGNRGFRCVRTVVAP